MQDCLVLPLIHFIRKVADLSRPMKAFKSYVLNLSFTSILRTSAIYGKKTVQRIYVGYDLQFVLFSYKAALPFDNTH